VASSEELREGSEHRATEPNCIALHAVRDDVNVDGLRLDASSRLLDCELVASVDKALDITLETTAKVLEHSGATRKDDVLVESTTSIDGRGLDSLIDEDGEGSEEVRGEDFGVEEDLRSKEALITDIDSVGLLADGVQGCVLLEPLCGLSVVLGKLLCDIRADIAIAFLDALGLLLDLRGRDALVTLTEELEDKASDVVASDGDVLDARADDIALSDGDDVGHTITTVDNSTSESTVVDSLLCPGSSKGKNSLHGDVEAGHVEGLKEDLCKVLTVLRGVEWWLSEEEVVVLRLSTEILEDGLLPVHLHVCPVVDLTVTHRIAQLIGLGCSGRLIANVKVQILNALRSHTSCGLAGSNSAGNNKAGLIVAGITHLGVAGTVVNNNCRQ